MPNLPYISPELLRQYQKEVISYSSPATTKRRMAALKRFFGWAHKEGHIPENPIPQIPAISVPTQEATVARQPHFKPSNLLKLGIPAVLVILLFLLAGKVKLPIPFLPAPAQEETALVPRPTSTPLPQIQDTGATIASLKEEVLKLVAAGVEWATFTDGNLLIGGAPVSQIALSTGDTTDGDITINPDGSGITHFLFEGTGENFLNAQAPNLTNGSLYYGVVANNASGYDLIRLQSGSKPITRFSVDALGNTDIGGNLDVSGNISTLGTTRLTLAGALTNVTGYSQVSGNFTIAQGAGDTATITKKASALNDLLTLTLDERGTANSTYSTLTLKRYDGGAEAMALLVDEGNAQFDGQLRLGRFATDPAGIGSGSVYYNTANNLIKYYDGTQWRDLGLWTDGGAITYLTSTTDNLAVGGTTTAAAFYFDIANNTLTSPALKFDDNNLTSAVPLTVSATALNPALTQGIIDAINDAWNAATGGGGGLWSITGSVIHPTVTTNKLAVGGTDSTAPVYITDTGVITFSTDTNLYRLAANSLATDDALTVGGNLDVNGTTNDIAGTLNLSGGALTSTGALTITPQAGNNLNINLSTTGDLAVNTDDLYVDTSAGNVGIGTTGPVFPLHITKSTAGAQTTLFLQNNAGASAGYSSALSFGISTANSEMAKINAIRTNRAVSGDTDLAFSVFTNNGLAEKMRILDSGNVGIGTATPSEPLQVVGNIRLNGRVYGGSGTAAYPSFAVGDNVTGIYGPAVNTLGFSVGGVEKARFDSSGNLGIDDTTPDAKLEVLATTEQLRLTNVDDTTDCRFTVSDTGDITIDCLGSGTTEQLVLGDGDTINIGGSGSTDVAYNIIGDSTTGASVSMNSDDDLYIEGNLEVDGTIYGAVVGTVPWSEIDNPTANLSLSHAEYTTIFTWDTATDAAKDYFTFGLTNDLVTDTSAQRLLILQNNNSTGSTATENLLVLNNADLDEAVTTGIQILSEAGAITTAIDVSDDQIGAALAFGTNDIDGTNFDVTGATGNITTAGDIAINGDDITSDGTALTINVNGASAGNLVLADTDTINVGGLSGYAYSSFASGTDAKNEAAIASDNDVYIGGDLEVDGTIYATDLTCTDCLDFTDFEDTLDLDANLILNQGAFTWTQNFTGTTTTGLTYNANSLTSGSLMSLASTSTTLTSGGLLSLDWSPGSTTTATGDLFAINIGPNGNIGNLLNVKDNGSSLFSVSETVVTSNLPTTFTSSGDVSIAYDLIFTNQTASNIKTYAPFTLEVGESFESNDLTLKTYNSGDIVLDSPGGVTLAQAQAWDLADSSTSSLSIESGLMNFDTTNSRVGIGVTSPGQKLDISGNLQFSGALMPNSLAGTSGYVLTSQGAGVAPVWIAAGGLGVKWNSLQNPDGPLSLSMGTYTTAFNWATGTGTDNLLSLTSDTSANGTGALLNIQTGASSTLLPLRVRAGAVEALTVNAAGNVGIGTTAPAAQLDILGTSSGTTPSIKVTSGYIDIPPAMKLSNSLVSNDLLFYLPLQGSHASSRNDLGYFTRTDTTSGSTSTYTTDSGWITHDYIYTNIPRFEKSFIGRGIWVENQRRNLLQYSSFEDGGSISGWTNSGLETFTTTTAYRKHQSYAASLADTNATGGQAYRSYTLTSGQNYPFYCYALNNTAGAVRGVVDSSVVQLWAGSDLTTSYTLTEGGWYKIAGTISGTGTAVNYGVDVKASKAIYLDGCQIEADYASTNGVPYSTTLIYNNSTNQRDRGEETLYYYIWRGTFGYESSDTILEADKGTVSFWFNPDWAANQPTTDLYLLQVPNVVQVYYSQSDDKIYGQMYNGTDWTTVSVTSAAQTFAASTNHYLSFRWDNTVGTTLNIDGTETSYTGTWTAQTQQITTSTLLYVGSKSTTGGRADALISDFAVFGRSLTASEVAQIYHNNAPIEDFQRADLVTLQQNSSTYQRGNINITGTAAFGGTVSTPYLNSSYFGLNNAANFTSNIVFHLPFQNTIEGSRQEVGTFVRPDAANGSATVLNENTLKLTSVDKNIPRFDRGMYADYYYYNTNTRLGNFGVYEEESRQNLALNSSFESLTGWSGSTGCTGAQSTVQPLHSDNALNLTSTQACRYFQTLDLTGLTVGTNIQVTAYVWRNETNAWTGNVDNTIASLYARTDDGLTALSTTYTSLGNGWFRLTAEFASTAASNWDVGVYLPSASRNVYVDAFQVETTSSNGSTYFPTSYIPTTSSAVARAAETLSYPLPTGFKSEKGGFTLTFKPNWTRAITNDNTDKYLFYIPNVLRVRLNATSDYFVVEHYNGSTWVATVNTATADVTRYAWNSLSCGWYWNYNYCYLNASAYSSSTGWTPQNPDGQTIYIGSDDTGANQANAQIASFALFETYLLPAQQYQLYLNRGKFDDYFRTDIAKLNDSTSTATQSGSFYISGLARTGIGTAAIPAYSFSLDPNTGIFSPGIDTLSFTTGGIEQVRIDSSGNIGIGTTSPAARLDIVGSQNFTAFTAPGALTAGTPTAGGACTPGTHSYKVTFTSVGSGETTAGTVSSQITCVLTTGQTVPLSAIPIGPAGTTGRRIYRTVAGDTGSYLLVTTIANNTATTYSDTTADGSLGAAAPTSNTTAVANIQTGGTTMMVIDSTGNVGIGTTVPASRLQVSNSGAAAIGKALLTLDQYENQDIFTASASGTTKMYLTNAGNLTFNQASAIDTTTGTLTLGSSGTSTTGFVQIGGGVSGTPDLLVLGKKNTGGDPTGTTGAVYINSSDKVMINENGIWKEICNKTDQACGTGTGSSWSALTPPSAPLSLGMSTHTTTFNWATGTGTNNLFTFSTDASANGTGSLVNIQTGASSTVLPLRVRAGSNEGLTVDASGNVGIGTTSPSTLLQLGASGTKLGTLGLAGSTSGLVTVQPAAAAGTWTMTLPTSAGTSGYLLQTNGAGVTSWVAPGVVDTPWSSLIAPTTDLSINMAAWKTTFTWNATTSTNNLFTMTDTLNNTGTGYLLNLTTASGSTLKPFHVSAAGNEAITVLANGNVGIGTTSPNNKLEIVSTTSPQSRVAYDTSNYLTTGVGSAGAATLTATGTSPSLNLQPDGTVNVNIAGGSSTTGCTITNSSGDLTCSGNITGSSSGTVGYWRRSGTTLSPSNTDDIVSISSNTAGSSVLALTASAISTSGTSAFSNTVTVSGSGASSTYYGEKLSLTNDQSINADTLYGKYISFTDAGDLANTVTGLYVDVTTANINDTAYAAIFQGGNVGIGTASPGQKLDISGNLQFSGALMPGSFPGTSGQFLISQGAGVTPIWTSTVPATSLKWNAIINPDGNLSLSHAEYTTIFTWDTATDVARDYFTMSITNDLVTDTSSQRLLVLGNANEVSSSGTTEALIVLENNDANEAVTNGILFGAGGANSPDFTYGINFDAADFTTEIVLENAETISNQTDGTIALGADSGAVTLSLSGTAATISNTAGNLTVNAASNLVLADPTIQLTGGTTVTLDLFNAATTNLSILNSTGGVAANVSIEGDLTVQGGTITGANAEAIEIGSTNDQISFTIGAATEYTFNATTFNAGANTITNVGTNITADAGLTISSSGAGGITLDSGSGSVVLNTDDDLLPTLGAGTADIGSLATPWDNIYAVAGDFSGTVTVSDLTCTDCISAADLADTLDFDTPSETSFTLLANNATTQNVFTFTTDGLTSGTGTTFDLTATGVTTAFSGDLVKLNQTQTYTGGAGTQSGNVLDIARSITRDITTAGDLALSGALATISDTAATSGAGTGTLTHSADVLRIAQNYTANTGAALDVTSAGGATGFALRINDDGTFTDSTPFVVDNAGNVGIGDTSPAAALTVGSGDLFQVNSSGIIAAIDGVAHTIDDVSGNLTLTSNGTSVMVADDLGVNGATSADITSTTTTASLFDSTVTTLNIGGAITALNLGDAATSKTIDIGGVTASGTDTINIATNATAADTINIGNVHASTATTISGGVINLTTDSTGNAEVVLPNDAIGPNEVFTTGQTDEYCLTYEGTGTTWEWQICGGSSAWSALTNPSTNLTLNMAAYTTTMSWDFTSNASFWSMNFDNNGGTAGNDYAVTIANAVSTNTTDDLNTEALLLLDNADTATLGSTIVDNAILITNTGGITSGIVDAIDASATEIDNALNFGANVILGTTGNINMDNFDVVGSSGNITTTGDLAVNGGDITSTATTFNFDIGNTGSLNFRDGTNNLVVISDQDTTGRLAVSGSLQVGGLTTAAYSRFGTATTGHGFTTSDDVLIGSDLEINGIIYLDGPDPTTTAPAMHNAAGTLFLQICSQGGSNPCSDVDQLQNLLTQGSWTIENNVNLGKAALIVNQQKGGDLFTASSGATTKFTIANNGNVTISGSGTMLTVGGGTGKIDVGTVDPVYSIGDKKFATYMAGMVGVKEETTGNISTSQYIPGVGYRTVIDFKTEPEGNDLWLFSRATDIKNNIDKMVVLLSPTDNTKTWYEVDEANYTLSIYSSRPTTISYRLTAPRFDYADWSNYNDNPEATGFVVEDSPLVASSEAQAPKPLALTDFEIVKEVPETAYKVYQTISESSKIVIEEFGTFANLVVGNIKAGAIESKEIATETFSSFQGTIDNMLITSGLVSPTIQTETISPLADKSDVKVKIGNEDINSGFGKLTVENTQADVVASIDTEGNATFSGTLEAEEIKTNEITAGKIYADEIVARNGFFAETNTASVSGITREDIEKILKEVEADQNLLSQASSWNINTATDSANLNELAVDNLYVTEQAAVNSLSVSSSLTIGSDLVIQSTINDQQLTINSIDTLSAPLSIQSLALAPVEIMAGKIRIDTNGDVLITGNLYVAGKIESSGITLKENETDPVNENGGFGRLLSLKNLDGSEVAYIDASGSAYFDKLVIAGSVATTSASFIEGLVTETNATAGEAIIPPGTREITIKNPKITSNTLVYVTPTSSTLNNVLYVKAKGEGFFVAGFSQSININTTFNWWVIDVEDLSNKTSDNQIAN